MLLFVFFFFQAEDGIRDRNVTGVQTCALPICIISTVLPTPAPPNRPILPPLGYGASRSMTLSPVSNTSVTGRCSLSAGRSEERRGGKEGRCGGGRREGKTRGRQQRERGGRKEL